MLASQRFHELAKDASKASTKKLQAFLEDNLEDKDQVRRICAALQIIADEVTQACRKCGIRYENIQVFCDAFLMIMKRANTFALDNTDLRAEVDAEEQRSRKAGQN